LKTIQATTFPLTRPPKTGPPEKLVLGDTTEEFMGRRTFTAEQIIFKLRKVEMGDLVQEGAGS
jgi:hypothetical protein